MINLARFARSLKGKRVEGSFAVSLKAKILLITSSSSLTATASNATTQKTCRPLTRSLPPDDAVSPLLLDALFVQNLPGSRQYMTEKNFQQANGAYCTYIRTRSNKRQVSNGQILQCLNFPEF